jgi:hypothetical protein
MSIVLMGSTSGSCTLQEQAVAGTTTLTLPTITGTVGVLVSGTAVASTSGTSIDFTSLPAGIRRITVMLNGVSTNGTSQPYLQIGDSGGIENTGYATTVCSVSTSANFTNGSNSVTAAFPLYNTSVSASDIMTGVIVISSFGSNTWMASGNLLSSTRTVSLAGAKTLSDVLDRVRITTAGGTDTFDAGSINILYE